MAIFAISDPHLSMNCDKPMCIFGSKWSNYTDRMKENWNKIITNDDYVIIPGDISWATYINDAKADFEYLHSLNGKKLISKGNHDYWWTTMNKMNTFLQENNFDSITFLQNNAFLIDDTAICATRGWIIPPSSSCGEDAKIFEREKQRLILSLEDAKSKHAKNIICALHYPPIDNSERTDFIDIMKEYNVSECIYGHLHAASHKGAPIGDFSGIRLRLVSSDYLNFMPILIKR